MLKYPQMSLQNKRSCER